MTDTVVANGAHPHTDADAGRRDFLYLITGAVGVAGVAAVAWPLIDQLNPAADTLALASLEYDLSKVAEGSEVTIAWRKSPVFIRHRTQAEIAAAVKDDHASMKDPATDESRHKPGKAQWLIISASCTHLGCVPTFKGGEYQGWMCPCHGSVYDTSGRIRKGPAPKNLPVIPYTFLSDTKVKIG